MVSQLVREERLLAVESLEIAAPKTKLLIDKLAQLGLTRALILVEAYEEKLFLAARNIPYVDVMPVASLDPLSLIKHDRVIATVGALKLLEQRLGGTPESTAAEAGVAHE
jgi:large subunit ribosomal protein L4